MVSTSPQVITRLQRSEVTPLFLPGQVVRVEPLHKFGFFVMPRSQTPEVLPEQLINIATPWSQKITKASDSGTAATFQREITELKQNALSLAQMRMMVLDGGINVKMYQPNAAAKFTQKNGAILLHKGNTGYPVTIDHWAQVPEFFVFEDQTPIFLEASSRDLDEDTYFARVQVVGVRYPLAPIRVRRQDQDRVTALTISVEAKP